MSSSNTNRGSRTQGRKARLEEQLKANLRKRKDQARARADTKPGNQDAVGAAGEENEAAATDGARQRLP
jgi:hypothetical protein